MGMDLKPIAPTADAPRYPSTDPIEPNAVRWGRYNWSGWSLLINTLESWGVDVSEFDGCNDGKPISVKTCLKVADAIEANVDTLDQPSWDDDDRRVNREWLRGHIPLWRTCGGYHQL